MQKVTKVYTVHMFKSVTRTSYENIESTLARCILTVLIMIKTAASAEVSLTEIAQQFAMCLTTHSHHDVSEKQQLGTKMCYCMNCRGYIVCVVTH